MFNPFSNEFASIIQEFCSNSSIPGINHISSAKTVISTFFWISISVLITCGASFHLFHLICTYTEHNYYTSITNDKDQLLQVSDWIKEFIVV